MSCSSKVRSGFALALLAVCASVNVWSQAAPRMQPGDTVPNQKPSILDQVGLDQRLNQQVPLDATFLDEHGQAMQLKQYFGSKPVILIMVYYQCPMLCTQILNGVASSLKAVSLNPGRDFEIVAFSFDPKDTPAAEAEGT